VTTCVGCLRGAAVAAVTLTLTIASPAAIGQASTPAEPAAARTAAGSADAEIGRALRERLDAYGRGDADAWGRYVADECLCGPSTKGELQQEMRARPAGVRIFSGPVTGLEVRVQGDAAAARYRVTDFTAIGSQQVGVELVKAETYVKRGGRWLLIGGAETVLPVDPPIAAVDPSAYDALVGRYEYGPGVVDVVTRDGARLVVQATGQPPEELFPETATAFFLKGQPWRYAFELRGGTAVALRFRMFGRDLVARRIDAVR
jgi:hypothetical protein